MSEEDIFLKALEIDPGAERDAFLDQACGADSELRTGVESLIQAHEGVGTFLAKPFLEEGQSSITPFTPGSPERGSTAGQTESPTHVGSSDVSPDFTLQKSLPRISGYELLSELGRGGMGVVYLARQTQAKRLVAVKVIRADRSSREEDHRRFRTEAEAMARIIHPHVVQIFEVGEDNDQLFFSMEYCSQGNLADYLAHSLLSREDTARILIDLAKAIQAAHEAQILHRDLKPANVLLAKRPDVGSGSGQRVGGDSSLPPYESLIVKVTDFGLAKKLDTDTQTKTGLIVGSPSYMAPEQAKNDGEVSPATDVYSLGAILYRCLTGRSPFLAVTSLEMILKLTQEEPVPPRRMIPDVPKDLETICLKCLQNEPARRYQSAQELAEDLERFLQGKPIRARPVSVPERTVRWCRRNPVTATLLAIILVVLTGGIVATGLALRFALIQAKEAMAQKGKAEEMASVAKDNEKRATEQWQQQRQLAYVYQLMRAERLVQAQPDKAMELLHDYEACPIDLRSPAWYWFENLCERSKKEWKMAPGFSFVRLALSPNGTTLATTLPSGAIELRDISRNKVLRQLKGLQPPVQFQTFSPSGRLFAAHRDGAIRAWRVADGQEIAAIKPSRRCPCLRFSPDEKALLIAAPQGQLGRKMPFVFQKLDLKTKRLETVFKGSTGTSKALVISPDGKMVASAQFNNTVDLVDAQSGAVTRTLTRAVERARFVAFSPNGSHLVASGNRVVQVWDLKTQNEIARYKISSDRVTALDVSDNGRRIALGSSAGNCYLCKPALGTLQVLGTFMGGRHSVSGVVLSPDGDRMIWAAIDSTVRLRHLKPGPVAIPIPGALIGADKKARRLLLNDKDKKSLLVWDREQKKILTSFAAPKTKARPRLSPDGRFVSIVQGDGATIRLQDIDTKSARSISGDGFIFCQCFSLNGEWLAVGRNKKVELWGTKSRKLLATLGDHGHTVSSIAINPEGDTLAVGLAGTIQIWDLKTRKKTKLLQLAIRGGVNLIERLRFSSFRHPGGTTRILASGSRRGAIHIWDVEDGAQMYELSGHQGAPRHFAFHPGGTTLVSVGSHRFIRLWHLPTGKQVGAYSQENGMQFATFTPDGTRLLSGGEDSLLREWDLSPDQTIAVFKEKFGAILSTSFSQDQKVLRVKSALAHEDGTIQDRVFFWDLTTGQRVKVADETGFGPDTRRSPNGRFELIIGGHPFSAISVVDHSIPEAPLHSRQLRAPELVGPGLAESLTPRPRPGS